MKVKKIINKITYIWFASLFTLGSSIFKMKLGLISLSPAVIIPAISLGVSTKIRKAFFNENLNDKNFKYVIYSVLGFMLLMFYQTILSDWHNRAISELFKTTLFFFTTHIFFSIIISSRNLYQSIRISLYISIFFVAYLSYLYFVKFGAAYIGVAIDVKDRSGTNTLALFIFLNIVMSVSLISLGRYYDKKQYLNYLVLAVLFIFSILTGSRFGIVFPALFLLPIIINVFLKRKLYISSLIRNIFISLFIIAGFIYLFPSFQQLFLDGYFLSLERLIDFGQNNSDSERLILLNTGINCFINNNILIGHGVKDYLSCVMASPLKTDYILHNDHLSILNNVGILGYLFWIFAIANYSKLLNFSTENFIFRFGALIYLLGLLVIDGYNSPIFALLLAFSRWEWFNKKNKN